MASISGSERRLPCGDNSGDLHVTNFDSTAGLPLPCSNHAGCFGRRPIEGQYPIFQRVLYQALECFFQVALSPASKVQNGNSVWHESFVAGTFDLERNGVVADNSTDCGDRITEASVFLAHYGGGSLVLPAGISKCTTVPVLADSGILLVGHSVGGSQDMGGSILHLARASAGPKMIIGPDSSTQAQNIGLSRLRLLGSGDAGKLLHTLNVRDVRLEDLSFNNTMGGFIDFGSSSRQTVFCFMRDIEGNVVCATGESAIGLANFAGGLYAHHLNMEGPGTPVDGSIGWDIPNGAFAIPDGINMADCHFGLFAVGMQIKGGVSNANLTNITLDRITGVCAFIEAHAQVLDLEMNGFHCKGLFGHPTKPAADYGFFVHEDGADIKGLRIRHPRIAQIGKNAIWLVAGENVRVLDPDMTDIGMDQTATYAAIQIEAGMAHFQVRDPTVKLEAQGDLVSYVVDNQSTNARASITGIQAGYDPTAGYVHNPNRGSLETRRVRENAGILLMSGVSPEFRHDGLAASQTALQMTLAADFVAPLGNALGWRPKRRCRIVGVWAQSNAAVTNGTATFFPAIDGTSQAGQNLDAVLNASNQFRTVELAAGLAVNADQKVDIRVTTSASWSPTTSKVIAGFYWVED